MKKNARSRSSSAQENAPAFGVPGRESAYSNQISQLQVRCMTRLKETEICIFFVYKKPRRFLGGHNTGANGQGFRSVNQSKDEMRWTGRRARQHAPSLGLIKGGTWGGPAHGSPGRRESV